MKVHQVRFTISVDEDVHQAFVEMAEAGGTSLSATVGAWLRDTTEAARFVSARMRELREQPSAALLALAEKQDEAAAFTRARAEAIAEGRLRVVDDAPRAGARPRRAKPPSSLTGVNSPRRGTP